jgi:putative transcriptional regulator
MPARPLEPLAPGGGVPGRNKISDNLPAPIAHKYGLALDSIPWKPAGEGVWHHRLALSPGVEGDLRLFKFAAGYKLPLHGHGGMELTLVIDGAFADETGEYHRGDVQDLDEETEHQPVVDKKLGCICLIASTGRPLLR